MPGLGVMLVLGCGLCCCACMGRAWCSTLCCSGAAGWHWYRLVGYGKLRVGYVR